MCDSFHISRPPIFVAFYSLSLSLSLSLISNWAGFKFVSKEEIYFPESSLTVLIPSNNSLISLHFSIVSSGLYTDGPNKD
jgi:hypothetical protein